jgi:hypothetical protein
MVSAFGFEIRWCVDPATVGVANAADMARMATDKSESRIELSMRA